MHKNPVINYLFLLLNSRYEYFKTPKDKRRGIKQQLKRRLNQVFNDLEPMERSAYYALKSSDDHLEQWHKYKKPWIHRHPDDQLLFDMIENERFVFKNEGLRYDPKMRTLIMSQRYCPPNDLPSCIGTDRPMSYQGRLCVVPKAAYVHFPKWFKALRDEFLRGTKYGVSV